MPDSPQQPAPVSPDSLEVIRKFAETYAKRTDTYFCSDPGVTAVVLEGLARHKDELGGALCPCRHYEDKQAEVSQAFWNCPCVPMRERKECHCMLFLTEDNPFRGEQQTSQHRRDQIPYFLLRNFSHEQCNNRRESRQSAI